MSSVYPLVCGCKVPQRKLNRKMGQATRTTTLPLALGKPSQGGANSGKRAYLEATVAILNAARGFYAAFFLAHRDKLKEHVPYYSERDHEVREHVISADKLLTWAERVTVATNAHPDPFPEWNFSRAFPDFPFIYRRSVIKDAIGKVKSYLANLSNWQKSGKKKGQPGLPGASNHPTLYAGAFSLELDQLDQRQRFVRLKVYTGESWIWANYPVSSSRYFEQRRSDPTWELQSPKLVLGRREASLHFPQTKEVKARRVKGRKRDPDLVTVAVDLNVKQLAVITVRSHGKIIETVFVPDRGLDQHRYRHLKRVSRKQWLSGKPVKGEHSSRQLWRHIRRMNTDAAHKTARAISRVCANYPGCVLLFERLRKIKAGEASKSRRLNRKQANQLRGQINRRTREQVYAQATITVEVNPHGTSQYCARCGAKGQRFSLRAGKRVSERGGKLFCCPVCHYEVQADFNASVNIHHAFFGEFHWQPRPKRSG
jgi:putative transposase